MNNKIFCGSHDLTETTAQVTYQPGGGEYKFYGGGGQSMLS